MHGLLNAQVGARQVGANHGVPVVLLHAQGEAVPSDGGVVHENVESAEFFEDLLEARFYLFGVRHVHLHGERLATLQRDNLLHQCRELFFISRSYSDLRACFRERQCGVAAYALRCAGHQGYFVLQAKHSDCEPLSEFSVISF